MSELRQRKTEGARAQGDVTPSAADTAEKYAAAVSSMAPNLLKPYLSQAVPVARKIAELVEASIPIIRRIRLFLLDVWTFLKPYKPDLLLPAMTGLVMCFFGGYFLTLIAAAEAYHQCSHETVVRCFGDLYSEFENCKETNKKDDKVRRDLGDYHHNSFS